MSLNTQWNAWYVENNNNTLKEINSDSTKNK